MSQQRTIQLEPTWLEHLEPEFHKPYMQDLRAFLVAEKKGSVVYPPGRDMFNAFTYTPFDSVRFVV